MGLVKFINSLLPRRIQGNDGFISAILPAIGKLASSPVGMGAISTGLSSLFKGKDTELEDLRSPEQIAAQNAISQLGQTGSFGGINLGEAYTGSLGSFDATDAETQALARLQGLFGGQDINTARDTFTNLADTKFDPSDPTSGYAEFSRALAREGQASEDVINRESAITGNRFGTAIQGSKVDLAERMQDIRGSKLAELFQGAKSSQLAGAQGLTGLTSLQAGLAQQEAQQGALERQLKNQEATANLTEFQRQRGEELGRIDLLTQAANTNPYMGVNSIPGQSPFSGLSNSLLKSIGGGIGDSIGDGTFSLKGLFGFGK